MSEVNVLERTDRIAAEPREGAFQEKRCNMKEVNVFECTDRIATEPCEGALPKGGATWTYLA